MEEKNVTAIVTSSVSYRENDKLVRLLCSDGKVLNAVMKGVKKPKAKLRFGAQVFAFCEYMLVLRGGYFTVIGCASIESLFDITQNIDKFIYGTLMLEAAETAAYRCAEPQIFIALMRALKNILYSQAQESEVAADFFISVLKISGIADDSQRPELTQLIHKFESEYCQKLKSAALLTKF